LKNNCKNLTLILPTWRIGQVPNNTSKRQMEFNSAFKGSIDDDKNNNYYYYYLAMLYYKCGMFNAFMFTVYTTR
jgi:hypothetical protein